VVVGGAYKSTFRRYAVVHTHTNTHIVVYTDSKLQYPTVKRTPPYIHILTFCPQIVPQIVQFKN